MERQSVTTDKDSGIENDANLWAAETMGDARYPLEFFLRVDGEPEDGEAGERPPAARGAGAAWASRP